MTALPPRLAAAAVAAIALLLAGDGLAGGGKPSRDGAPIAQDGLALAVLWLPSGASPAERSAAEELRTYLQRITGAVFVVRVESVGELSAATAIHVRGLSQCLRSVMSSTLQFRLDKDLCIETRRAHDRPCPSAIPRWRRRMPRKPASGEMARWRT